MAKQVFSNNASSLLAASISPSDLTIQVASGAAFPSPTGGDYFIAALVDADGDLELVKCTARSSDLLTVVRAQDGTTAQSWTLNVTRVELRLTAGTMGNFVQKAGDTMSGDLDFDDNEVQNARLTGDTVVVGGILVGSSLRGAEGDASNAIVVPGDGSRATAGGSRIVTEADSVMDRFPTGAVIQWYGSLLNIPTGWALCDGSNGTPDMRGRFARGAGGSISLNDTGGWTGTSVSVDAAGTHLHAVTIGGTVLSVDQMPQHSHSIWATPGSGSSPRSLTLTVVGVTGDGNGAAGSSYISNTGSGNQIIADNGGGESHTHSASMVGSGSHQHAVPTATIAPPWLGLYYIMKVAS